MVINFENMQDMVAEILDRQKRIEVMLCKPIEVLAETISEIYQLEDDDE